MKMAAEAGRLGIWYRDLRTDAVTTLQAGGPVSGTHPSSYDAFLSVIHPDERGLVVARMTAAVERGEDCQAEFRVLRPDGDLRWAYVQGRVVRDPVGKPIAITGLDIDITERKQAEEARRRLEAQVQHAQKMQSLGVLAGGIAHDFNNLLTAILGNLSFCLANVPPDHPSHDALAAADQAGWRAAELVRQLLDFSSHSLFRPEPTDLNTSLAEVVGILRRTIDPRIEVEVRPAPDLWAVQANPGQISQVLMNLCLNARDAMPEGGRLVLETANVIIGDDYVHRHLGACPGEFVCVRISDTGPGIPAEIRPRLFQPFFTTKEPGKGTGLGLAMVFGIVQQHQGWVECANDVDRGARFDIYLPRSSQGHAPPQALAVSGALPTGRETILLADDEPLVRSVGKSILQRQGYHVLLAQDGLQAVEMFERGRADIDLVILDLTMPRLSGQDAFRRLLQIDPGVRVLFASGYTSEYAHAAGHEGILGFINKPFRPENLARSVRGALDRAS
jgi:signal transduction histidine kinase/CheY-like chemotaxis protein